MSVSRLYASLFAFLLFAGAGRAPSAHGQATRTVNRTVDLAADGELKLDTFSGRVRLTTWDRPSVHLEARIEDEDKELVDRTEIRVDARPGRVAISEDVEKEGGGGFLSRLFGSDDGDHPSVYYTLTVPASAKVTLDAFSSDIQARDLRGGLALDVFSADATIENLRGPLRADMYSGDLTVRGLRGGARVETYSGDVDLTFDQLAEDASFESFSGDVTLHLPSDAGFDLVAELGMGGDFESDFPTDALRVEDGDTRGSIGGGGPRVRFETFSGTLRLRQR